MKYKEAINSIISIFLLLTVFILILAVLYNHHPEYDLTKNARFTLQPESLQVMKTLTVNNKKIKAVGFYKEDGRQNAQDLLELYKKANSNNFDYVIINPDRYPKAALDYGIKQYNTIVLSCDDRNETIENPSEETLTNGILKIVRNKIKCIYFVIGHGEANLSDLNSKTGLEQTKAALNERNYETKELVLARTKEIPTDCSCVVIVGPQTDYTQEETNLLKNYLEKDGGSILLLLDPGNYPLLESFVIPYGIKLRPDVLIDKLSRVFGGDFLSPVVITYKSHPITKDFNIITIFPYARSIEIDSTKMRAGVFTKAIASISTEGWGETDLELLKKEQKARYDKGLDLKGPCDIASVTTIDIPGKNEKNKKQGRLVVIGDSDFITSSYINFQGNKTLFLNTIKWLSGEEDMITLAQKKEDFTPLLLTKNQGLLIFYVNVVGLPLLWLIAGIVVFIKRKKQ